ncbi:hypothetical protein SNOG_07388 [Parastagonospora nodorum SN15]|uniref:Uncharacterized protein n=1 Tax=Phaeosphaeria nodorum (strain SN15 / ATCC MYA-4574 / FGSC 10173) TaxID=321614 RepID=Q0ULH6_PHANO|nr:hypothetical protein SNOG_07388 [Parastagonospora nodorum SN15]EAT84854.1 hypothetical protein SNOG_07388 [Parastagonospora nodorum SN15]
MVRIDNEKFEISNLPIPAHQQNSSSNHGLAPPQPQKSAEFQTTWAPGRLES